MKRLATLALMVLLATTVHAENKKKVVKEAMKQLNAYAQQFVGFTQNPPAGVDKDDLKIYGLLISLDIGNIEADMNLYYFAEGSREEIEKDMRTLSRDLEDRPEPHATSPEGDRLPKTMFGTQFVGPINGLEPKI